MERIKSWVILCLGGALAASLTFNMLRRPCPSLASGILADATANSPYSAPIVKQYQDSSGVSHVVIDARANEQIRRETEHYAAPIAKKIDSLADALALKPKQIEGYTAVVMAASRDSVRFLIRAIDSLRGQTRSYRDKYLSLVVRDPLATDTADKGDFDFAYDADLKFVDYALRRKILGFRVGKKDFYTDISSSDPRLRIKGVDRFTVQRKVPPLGLRVQAVTSYNLFTKDFSAGAGLRMDIGDFNAGVNYIYNFGLQRWVPSIFTKYDIVQFGQ